MISVKQGGQSLLVNAVFQMQEVGGTQGGPQRPFSVLDRLLLTHPVWLQLSLNKNSALYILLREPVGVCMKYQNIIALQRTQHGRFGSRVRTA